MKHTNAAYKCSKQMQHTKLMQHTNAAYKCSIQIQHAAYKCSLQMQHTNSTCSIQMQHTNAAYKYSILQMQWAVADCSFEINYIEYYANRIIRPNFYNNNNSNPEIHCPVDCGWDTWLDMSIPCGSRFDSRRRELWPNSGMPRTLYPSDKPIERHLWNAKTILKYWIRYNNLTNYNRV